MNDTTTSRFSRIALIGAALLAVTAIGVKLWRDRTPDVAAATTATAPNGPQDVGAMISSLEAKLKADPNDAEGWRMLGWSFFQTQRYAEAAMAYKRATALKPDNADYWSSLGEALVTAGPGTVPAEAKAAFDRAVALDPRDPRARYFIGVSKDMAGDHKGAINDWFALLQDTPAGAPWEADVRRTIQAVGERDKIEVATRLAALKPAAPAPGTAAAAIPGPNPDQMRAATQLPAGQQEAMIAGMVEGLAAKLKANPKNVEGWIMLMRSYTTLGRGSDAGVAYRAAIAANPGAKAELEDAAKTLGVAR
ncbi:MAG: tetratricopeptide repeat protein [Sphingomonas sp.]